MCTYHFCRLTKEEAVRREQFIDSDFFSCVNKWRFSNYLGRTVGSQAILLMLVNMGKKRRSSTVL